MPKQQQQHKHPKQKRSPAATGVQSVHYALLTPQKTRHVVGPPQKSLLLPASLETYAFPLLSIWLPECGFPAIRQQLMFVYAEYAESSRGNRALGLSFHVAPDGTYTLTNASARTFERFRLEVSLPTSLRPKRFKAKHVKVAKASIPTPVEQNDARRFVADSLGKNGARLGPWPEFPIYGAPPDWVQSPGRPLDPSSKPMTFIGQTNASYFTDEVAGFELFLYYSEKHRLVTQIAQNS